MGLDVYFFKMKNANTLLAAGKTLDSLRKELHGVITPEQEKKLDSVRTNLIEYEHNKDSYIELAYFRKAYFIQSYFRYEDDCTDMAIDREELRYFLSLLKDWKTINADKSKYTEDKYNETIFDLFSLENYGNFWLGYMPYEIEEESIDNFISSIENVLNDTDPETDTIILFCWW